MPIAQEEIIVRWPDEGLHGRRQIFTDKKVITKDNVAEVLAKALTVHNLNRAEIQYLWDFYRGKQDVRHKTKVVRAEINNKVMVNRANEIVTFKSAYFLEQPIQYVSNGGDDDISDEVKTLNEYMRSESKESKDKELVDWMHIAGVGVRMAISDKESGEEDNAPFNTYTLDPRYAFCIYYSGVGHKKLAGCMELKDDDGKTYYAVYTENYYFEVTGGKVTGVQPRTMPYIPLIEYPNNMARMGAFEVVIPLLNAINDIESNRVDNIQDFVNAFDVFQNCEIDGDTYKHLTSGGQAIMIKGQQGLESKVYRISSELNQTSTQTIVDDLYDEVLTICGMPNRNGGSSTSDTGQAVIARDGWASAESRASDTEKMYNRSEREFLRIVLYICKGTTSLDLKLSDIKVEHTRNNLSNMQSRMQVLTEGLNNDKIHPKIPWILSGISNAEEFYRISQEYYQEQQDKLNASLEAELSNGMVHDDRQDASTSGEEGGAEAPADAE